MKAIKRILPLLLAALCLSMLPVAAAQEESSVYQLTENLDKIKCVGRTAVDENGIYVAWSNSGIAFRGEFEGDVRLQVNADTSYYPYHNIAVVVDGQYDLPSRYPIYNGERTYTIASVEKGEHTIEIFKLNEARWGYFVLESLTVNGTLGEKPADKELQIEFIGDSITCGYGIYPSGGKFEYPVINSQTLEEEDSYYSYAALVARRLNADASFISLGGWGIVQGGDKREENVPSIYDLVCGVAEGPCQKKWDFAAHPVDIVISNQGTNDWTLWNNGGRDEIYDGVVKFCKQMRKVYPEAEIIWCYGMMHKDLESIIQSAVESVGDEQLHYLSLPLNTSGGNQHPDYWGQDAAAETILQELKSLGY